MQQLITSMAKKCLFVVHMDVLPFALSENYEAHLKSFLAIYLVGSFVGAITNSWIISTSFFLFIWVFLTIHSYRKYPGFVKTISIC